MEKIKITREQEKEFKEYLGLECGISDIESYIRDYGVVLQTRFPNLYKVKPEQFALLLCGWYEVEQPFNVGDWVYDKGLQLYRKIEDEISFNNRYVPLKTVSLLTLMKSFEKITEPWKIMLLELGREKPEFKVGDKLSTETDHFTINVHNLPNVYKIARNNEIVYFHPIESRIELKGENK